MRLHPPAYLTFVGVILGFWVSNLGLENPACAKEMRNITYDSDFKNVFLCRLCNRDQHALHHRHPRDHLLLLPLLKTGSYLSHLLELNIIRRNNI